MRSWRGTSDCCCLFYWIDYNLIVCKNIGIFYDWNKKSSLESQSSPPPPLPTTRLFPLPLPHPLVNTGVFKKWGHSQPPPSSIHHWRDMTAALSSWINPFRTGNPKSKKSFKKIMKKLIAEQIRIDLSICTNSQTFKRSHRKLTF